MLKLPKPQWFNRLKKAAAIAFVAESLAFAGSYIFWYRLNTNRGKFHANATFIAKNRIKTIVPLLVSQTSAFIVTKTTRSHSKATTSSVSFTNLRTYDIIANLTRKCISFAGEFFDKEASARSRELDLTYWAAEPPRQQ